MGTSTSATVPMNGTVGTVVGMNEVILTIFLVAVIAILVGIGIATTCFRSWFRGPPGLSIRGPQGVSLPPCRPRDGCDGRDGNQIIVNAGDPATVMAIKTKCLVDGDVYIDILTNNLWQWQCDTWVLQGNISLPSIIPGTHTVTGTWVFANIVAFTLSAIDATGVGTYAAGNPLTPTTPYINITGTAAATIIENITNTYPGRMIILVNKTTGTLSLNEVLTGNIDTNQIATTVTTQIGVGSFTLLFDNTSSRWTLISYSII